MTIRESEPSWLGANSDRWESLEEKPSHDQWRYFDPTGDSL